MLHCTPVPNLVTLGSRPSELEGIRLKNEIVPWGHNFDPIGSSLTWHVYPTGVHLLWKFRVSATFFSNTLFSEYCFAKGSRGGTWHVPRGTWRHVTNAIVVPALWRIFWCLSRPDRTFRSGVIHKSLWTDPPTHPPTHPQTGSAELQKSTLPRGNLHSSEWANAHSSSLRFWTSGRHYFILPWVQNRNCLIQKVRKSKFWKFKILTPLIFGPP